MSARPVVHVTNWSSRGLHGPGRRFTIMAKPRPWEHGDGRVHLLMPAVEDLDAIRAGTIDIDTYRQRFVDRCARIIQIGEGWGRQCLPWGLEPGKLFAIDRSYPARGVLVADGDTLLCACKRDDAAAGRCHRVWAADLLAAAGWGVILDGKAHGL